MFSIKKDLIIQAILRWFDQNLLGTGLWQSNKCENRQFGLKQSQQMPQNWRRCAIELIRIWIHCLLDFCSILSFCWSNCHWFSLNMIKNRLLHCGLSLLSGNQPQSPSEKAVRHVRHWVLNGWRCEFVLKTAWFCHFITSSLKNINKYCYEMYQYHVYISSNRQCAREYPRQWQFFH